MKCSFRLTSTLRPAKFGPSLPRWGCSRPGSPTGPSQQIFISEATVMTRLVHIYGKLGVDNRTAATRVTIPRAARRRTSTAPVAMARGRGLFTKESTRIRPSSHATPAAGRCRHPRRTRPLEMVTSSWKANNSAMRQDGRRSRKYRPPHSFLYKECGGSLQGTRGLCFERTACGRWGASVLGSGMPDDVFLVHSRFRQR